MSLVSQISALATRLATEFNSVKSRVTALESEDQTIYGQKTFDGDARFEAALNFSGDTNAVIESGGALTANSGTYIHLANATYVLVPTKSVGSNSTDAASTAFVRNTLDVEVPVGVPMPWLTNTPPTGWLALNGQAVSRTTYPKLFAVFGTGYGSGDGSTTFNLPNLTGQFLRGAVSPFVGLTGGSNMLAAANLPPHGHRTLATNTGSESGHTHDNSHGHTIRARETGPGTQTSQVAQSGGTGTINTTNTAVNDHSGSTGAGSSHTHGIGTLKTITTIYSDAGDTAVGAQTEFLPPFRNTTYIVRGL